MSVDVVRSFEQQVIGAFAFTVSGGRKVSYHEYMGLPSPDRSGDEAAVVDMLISSRVLHWLGYESGLDFTYNDARGRIGRDRPDFAVHCGGSTVFVWEDKGTCEEFGTGDLSQLERYTAGTAGYAVWCNGRKLLLLRFHPRQDFQVLVSVDLLAAFDPDHPSVIEQENLVLFHRLLSKERFTSLGQILVEICVPETDWRPVPLDSPAALAEFINGSRAILRDLQLAARACVVRALEETDRRKRCVEELRSLLARANQAFLESLEPFPPDRRRQYEEELAWLEAHLGEWDRGRLDSLRPDFRGAVSRTHYEVWRKRVEGVDVAYRNSLVEESYHLRVSECYRIWKSRQPDPDRATEDGFAEQVAYVFFLRLMLARILEDKRILPSRIVSDGGLEAWRRMVQEQFGAPSGDVHGASLIAMLFRQVSAYYRHFFQQPVFDWYLPDDYLLVLALRHLNRYEFSRITTDIFGFTYEQYIDRAKRNEKGHFLTRPELVDFVLDLAGYSGRDIIGRKLLDPACGSGSFLVHAARRLRAALSEAVASRHGITVDQVSAHPEARIQLAARFVEGVQDLLYGMEIDPFACYLAELNLFVQVLDDLHYLAQHGRPYSVERFGIYCTDSLDLPAHILLGDGRQNAFDAIVNGQLVAQVDEAYPVKARLGPHASGFMYVVSNPPYITSKRQELQHRFPDIPFYRPVLSGDPNTYLAFIRLGQYYVASGGRLAFVVPLSLLGDESAAAARRCLSAGEWRLRSVARFYTALVLFPGVDQHVCVFVSEHTCAQGEDAVTVHGGNDVPSARACTSTIQVNRVVAEAPCVSAGPPGYEPPPWHSPWIVVPDVRSYDLWEHVTRRGTSVIGALCVEVVDARQGDANATHLKPQLVSDPGRNRVPVYSGRHIQPFAPLPPADQWAAVEPRSTLSPVEERARREVVRVASLERTECGFVVQEIVNIPVHCRIRGTWFERSRERPLVFTHQVWRFVARPGREEQALALFALVSSHLLCYLYGLISTNSHMLLRLLYRLPVPAPNTFPARTLAEAARNALGYRRALADILVRYGGRVGPRGEVALDPVCFGRASNVPSISVEDAMDRGLFEMPASGRVAAALARVRFRQAEAAFEEAVRLILGSRRQERVGAVLSVAVPEPGQAGAWLTAYREAVRRAEDLWTRYVQERRVIDAEVLDWYGVESPGIREMVLAGLPWEYQNRGNPGEDPGENEPIG